MMGTTEGLRKEALEEQHVSKTTGARWGCLEGAGERKATDLHKDCTPWRRQSCMVDRKLMLSKAKLRTSRGVEAWLVGM